MKDHLSFICDVGELSSALAGSTDLEAFLDRLVGIVAGHFESDVCSIYLREESTGDLVLRATRGLRPASVGAVRLSEGEGLVGASLQELRPILVHRASRHPAYRHFPEIGEEPYESFLAAPIVRGIERIGVLAVQRGEKNRFGGDDERALQAVAIQLAGTLENARALMELRRDTGAAPAAPETGMKILKGRGVSGGFAYGEARVLDRGGRLLERLAARVPSGLGPGDLERTIEHTARELEELQEKLAGRMPEASTLIFGAQLLMLRDSGFSGGMMKAAGAGATCGEAVVEVASRYMGRILESPHAYLREKVQDIEDVAHRLLANLAQAGGERAGRPVAERKEVVIARSLYPSDVVILAAEGVRGMVVAEGGAASHAAILARALGIPLIVTGETSILETGEGTPVALDGASGNVYARPERAVVERLEKGCRSVVAAGGEAHEGGTATRDGTRIWLRANINLVGEVQAARRLGAEGVGLYRTEFPFLIRKAFPSEEEQYPVYRRLVEDAVSGPVTFRTLDVGGEKALARYDLDREPNPELGLRSIRFSFRHEDLFRAQVRAILRAGVGLDDLRIMFPMISSVDELRKARRSVEGVVRELREGGTPCHRHPGIGAMVEVPAAVEVIDELAAEADFLSIGTNDLVQYLLAADRSNESVAEYYCPHHPAVLRALARVAGAALRAGTEVSVCGEMAHEERYLKFLLGVGIRVLSADPHSLPSLRRAVGKISLVEASAHAAALLAEGTVRGTAGILGLESEGPEGEAHTESPLQ